MPRGATGHDPDAADCGKLLGRQSNVRQICLASIVGIAPSHRVENRLRLLVNLLQHEVRKPALFRRGGIPGNLRQFSFNRLSLDIGEPDICRGHDRHIALLEVGHVTGMGEHRHNVGRDETRLCRCSHNQRTSCASGDHRSRFPLRNDGKRITPAHILRGSPYRLGQLHALLEISIDQMRHDFRVRFRMKLVALFLQLLFQRLIVFNDAIVYKHAAFRPVRVGILLRGLPVRGPSRMTDSHGAVDRFRLE
jgi:hypothetical protein